MTANAFDEDRKKALACGMDGFLSKPIVIEELISTLPVSYTHLLQCFHTGIIIVIVCSKPTDYESFVSACQAFDEVGIRGFTAAYYYDYTCMETLQGLSCLLYTSYSFM